MVIVAISVKTNSKKELNNKTEELKEKKEELKENVNELGKKEEELEKLNGEFGKKDEEIGNLRSDIFTQQENIDTLKVERDSLIEERDTLAEERDTLAEERDTLIVERDTLIVERDTLIVERDTEIKHKELATLAYYTTKESLKACISVVYNERKRNACLEYYSSETKKKYSNFTERVKTKAQRKLMRKGGAVVMSFVPGLGLLDILGDVAGILDDVTSASNEMDLLSETYTGLSDTLLPELVDYDETFMDTVKSFTNSFDNTFKDAVENLNPDEPYKLIEDDLENFTDDILQNSVCLEHVNAMEVHEQEQLIEDILRNVQEFVEEAYDNYQKQRENPDQNDVEHQLTEESN